ncbi:MAG: glycosyltransferase, partial [Eubacteriales bacterium]|nr:glycosyltransferase [Eubacteriales bacterium]
DSGLNNVCFLPYQDEGLLNEMLCAADVCVVALEPHLVGLAVPSKTYPILAAGRPILAVTGTDDDIADVVKHWDCGWIAGNTAEVTALIRHLLYHPEEMAQCGSNARQAHEKEYSRENAIEMYTSLIAKTGRDGSRPKDAKE